MDLTRCVPAARLGDVWPDAAASKRALRSVQSGVPAQPEEPGAGLPTRPPAAGAAHACHSTRGYRAAIRQLGRLPAGDRWWSRVHDPRLVWPDALAAVPEAPAADEQDLRAAAHGRPVDRARPRSQRALRRWRGVDP